MNLAITLVFFTFFTNCSPEPNPEVPISTMEIQAQKHKIAGRTSQAEALLLEIVKRANNHAEAYFSLGQMAHQRGDQKAAKEFFLHSARSYGARLKADPQDDNSLMQQAFALAAAGQMHKGFELIKKLQNSRDPLVTQTLALYRIKKQSDLKKAVAQLMKMESLSLEL